MTPRCDVARDHNGGKKQFRGITVGTLPIITQFINYTWSLFKVALFVALAAGIGAGLYYYQNLGDEIRQRVQAKIAAHYQDLGVEIHTAQLLENEGILIRGVTLRDPHAPEDEQILLSCDEILLACDTELTKLAQAEPQIKQMVIRRPRIIARALQDGTWNLSRLLPLPQFSKRKTEVLLEGGVIEVHDARRSPAAFYSLRDIQFQLTPNLLPNLLEPDTEKWAWDVRGKLRGEHLRLVEVQGRLEPSENSFRLQGSLSELQFGPELCAALPLESTPLLKELTVLRGEVGLTFQVDYHGSEMQPWNFQIAGQLQRGRIDDRRLPQVLNDVTAKFTADTNGIAIQELLAQNGPTKIKLAVERRGYAANAPLTVALEARHLFIGRSWEASLPEKFKAAWLKFQPAGEIDVFAKAEFDGTTWKPEATIQCLNVSFTYHKFQYRLDRTHGNMSWRDNHLVGKLNCFAGNKRIAINLDLQNPGENFTGQVLIQGKGLVLDQNILDALPEKPREVVKSLNPVGGNFDVMITASRVDPNQPKPLMCMRMDLHKVGIKFDKFPYPLMDVSGVVEMQDQAWRFHDLIGTNDKGRITCRGELLPAKEGTELKLNFVGTEISLEEELRDALPIQSRGFWNSLNPQGMIDMRASWVYRSADKTTELDLVATPLGDTVVVEPDFLPLRFDKVRGTFHYRPNRLEFSDVSAEHDRLPINLAGFCEHDSHGAFHVRFDKLTADRVRLERQQLQAALPAKLRRVAQAMQITGPLNIAGTFDIWHTPGTADPLTTAWDLQIDMRDGSIHCGKRLEHIDGAIRLAGQQRGKQLRMQGELFLDTLILQDCQLTDIRGPMWIDEQQIVLGSQVAPRDQRTPRRNITAKVYDGTLAADGWVTTEEVPRYGVVARLNEFDLVRFGKEQLPGKQSLSGKVNVGLELGGTAAGLHTLSGRGQMNLKDATLGELPVMVAMLKVFSIREPDRTAFDSGAIDFRIEGEHIYLDSIELTGNAISLLGTGEMNLERELQLVFSAVAGRSDWQLPFFKSALGSASQQFMEIHVGGTISDPQIKREAFPALKASLDQLQTERQERRASR
jgi:hypothetical protein